MSRKYASSAVLLTLTFGLTALTALGSGPQTGSRLSLHEGVVQTGKDFLIIPGAVENRSGDWIRSVYINVTFFDAAGRKIHSYRVRALRDRVPPGEFAVFKYTGDLSKIQGKYARYKLDVSAVTSKIEPAGRAEDGIVVSRSESPTEARGMLRETGNTPCRSPSVIAAAYDTESRILDAGAFAPNVPATGIARGQIVPFRVPFQSPEGRSIVNMRVWVSCAE